MQEKETEEKAVPEVSFRVEGQRVIFSTDSQDLFSMSAENLLRLLNLNLMKKTIEKATEPSLTLQEFCLIRRFLLKGLNFSEISAVLGMPLEELTASHQRFMDAVPMRPDGKIEDQEIQNEISRQRADKDEQDYVKTLPIVEHGSVIAPVGQRIVDLVSFNRLLKQGLSIKKIAHNWDLDEGSLRLFRQKNKKYLRYLK